MIVMKIHLGADLSVYLAAYDPDAADGRGEIKTTAAIERALRFDDREHAMRVWQTQSGVRPLRDDGKPNRPLTAHTVELVELPQ